MRRLALVVCLLAAGCVSPAPERRGQEEVAVRSGESRSSRPHDADEADERPTAEEDEADEDDGPSMAHGIRMWLPNRFFDVFDIVRARVKLGPGLGFTLRATEVIDLKFATWTCAWIGLHGPRLKPELPWPAGLETYSGAGIFTLEIEPEGRLYGHVECGAGVHALMAGVDVGFDILEVVDLVTGFLFIDFMGDDL